MSVDEELRRRLAENLFQKARFFLSACERIRNRSIVPSFAASSIKAGTARSFAGLTAGQCRGRGHFEAILSQFREIDPDMPFWVMTRRKNETRVANKTRAMYIFNVVAFIRSLRKAEIFVNGEAA